MLPDAGRLDDKRNSFMNGHEEAPDVRMSDGQFTGCADLFLKNRDDAAIRAEDISKYLGKDIRTVQRYQVEGFPIHRRQNARHGSVHAYKSEIDKWWITRDPALRQERPELGRVAAVSRLKRYIRPAIYLAAGIVLTLSALTARQLLFGDQHELASPPNMHSVVAVLEFRGLSLNSEDGSLAQDFTQRVIRNLQLQNLLRVIDASSKETLSATPPDLPRLATTLHADQVLSGTVAREHDELRIAAQVVDARSGKVLWRAQFENQASDTDSLESGLAHAVAVGVENALSVAAH